MTKTIGIAVIGVVCWALSGCASSPSIPPVAPPTASAIKARIVGVWHLHYSTILDHEMKVCGVSKVDDEMTRREIILLASELGRRHVLIIYSDGKWELASSIWGGDSDKEHRIRFLLAPGSNPNSDDFYKGDFYNNPKDPRTGTWRIDEQGRVWHTGVGKPYLVQNPGEIVVKDHLLELVDGKTGKKMTFIFERLDWNDPDPHYRQ